MLQPDPYRFVILPDAPKENSDYITGLRSGNSTILSEIYSRFFSGIKHMIQTNGGSLDDAKDVFQEALMVIYRQSLRPDFIVTVAFYTYLYAVSRKLWLKQLRRRSSRGEVDITDTMDIVEPDIQDVLRQHAEYTLYQDNFRKLGDECQKLLRLFVERKSVKELKELMRYSSESYTKKRKFQCKEKLIRLIKEDSRYGDL